MIADPVADALYESDIGQKIERVNQLQAADALAVIEPLRSVVIPGRPDRPLLVAPGQVSKRRLGSVEGRAALVHAVAHIEFNAINLALDAMYRFRAMPHDYYVDWLSVARDEARHFEMLSQRLADMGYSYGAFPAHNGLWQAAIETAHDPLVRMALVPRVLEARGLDVTPGMIQKLDATKDQQTADILRVILEEEVRHVQIGTRWFHYLCEQRGLDPDPTFLHLYREYMPGRRDRSLNLDARSKAGFSEGELLGLQQSV